MATNQYLPLGTPIVAKATLKRRQENTRDGLRKVWQRVEVPRTGIVAGVRTLSEGDTHYMGEDGIVYYPDKYLSAYLIAWDARRKLVLALVEDVTREEIERG